MQYYFPQLRATKSCHQLELFGQDFLAKKSLEDLVIFLGMSKHQLQLMSAKPRYKTFFIPKKKGGKRLIQTPHPELKRVQKKLAFAFQAVYYPLKPSAAYGFILSPEDEEKPRNIYSNACCHIGKKCLINVDLKDFFHQIKQKDLEEMFQIDPFQFTPTAARLLAGLCSYEKRLPMGAPTSPILSNFACRELDQNLEELAKKSKWVFTRYADDLSFSSDKKISIEQMKDIRDCIQTAGFTLNENKLILRYHKDKPEVTGLILDKKKPDISPGFLKGIRYDLKILKALMAPRMLEREIFKEKPVKKLSRSIRGQINFVGFIRGKDHNSYRKLLAKFEDRIKEGE